MRGDRKKGYKKWVALAALIGIGALVLVTYRTGGQPGIELSAGLPGIGKATAVNVSVVESRRGLYRVEVELIQGDRTDTLAERSYQPRPAWNFWSLPESTDAYELTVGSETQKSLREGEATIRVSVWPAPTWLRHPAPQVEELTLPVRLRPPSVQVFSVQHYVAQGGAEVVLYRVGETSVRDGVRAGDWWFPGYPLPGGAARDRFALFAAPYDLDDVSRIRVEAEDDVGNVASTTFVDQFFRKPVKTDTIGLSDGFMAKVVPEILSRTPELEDKQDLLANYLQINGDLRKQNAETLKELADNSQTKFAWSEVFLPLPDAQVMSSFADRRTYVYDGETVDRQDHLGFDLASVRRAPVPAANSGRVVLADYFGIYGNTVVVDHGYGLLTLYAHLSSIEVVIGDEVSRGESVGRTGETGLAGGDHLHFTILIHGLAVDPREWWDAHWLTDRLDLKLGAALPFGE